MSTTEEVRDIQPADDGHSRFPGGRFGSVAAYFNGYTEQVMKAASSVEADALDQAAAILLAAHARDAVVFACGNGGSASIANHLLCDHTKGIGTATDLRQRVVSLSGSVELLTAIANDLAYEEVFVHQLQSQARPGDVLFAISSSGRSANIVRAVNWARENDMQTIALTGFGGGAARLMADVAIHIDAANYGIVEDLHQAVMHVLAQYIRHSRMTADTISATVF